MKNSLSYLRETLTVQSTESISPGPHQDSCCSLRVHLCQRRIYRRTTTKCHPEPHAAVSMNLALHSEKHVSISATLSLVNFSSVCLLPCVLLYAWMGEYTTNSKMPWVGMMVIINSFCAHPWSWRIERLTKHSLLPSFACSLPPLLLHWNTITGPLLLLTLTHQCCSPGDSRWP